MIKVLKKRFAELADQLEQVEATPQSKNSERFGTSEHVDYELLLNWEVKVGSLIVNACGEKSQHFT